MAPNNSVMHLLKGFNIMKDPLLKFDPIGWVEGNKVAKEGFVTHKHHVIDRPKKVRKFAVRCVCEVKL